jgi:hypothetical protein
MMKRKTVYIIAFVFLLMTQFACDTCKAQSKWYINPGIKLGYVFGSNGGFIFGAEVSATTTRDNDNAAYGFFISTEALHSTKIIHVGVEAFPRILYGVSIGPSIVSTDQGTRIGAAATIFGGIFALPYYRFTYVSDTRSMHELGTFLKLLIPMQKETLSLGG